MPKVDIINYNIEELTEVYLFILFMSMKNIITDKIGIFKNLTI